MALCGWIRLAKGCLCVCFKLSQKQDMAIKTRIRMAPRKKWPEEESMNRQTEISIDLSYKRASIKTRFAKSGSAQLTGLCNKKNKDPFRLSPPWTPFQVVRQKNRVIFFLPISHRISSHHLSPCHRPQQVRSQSLLCKQETHYFVNPQRTSNKHLIERNNCYSLWSECSISHSLSSRWVQVQFLSFRLGVYF